jgi:hypothetical protein
MTQSRLRIADLPERATAFTFRSTVVLSLPRLYVPTATSYVNLVQLRTSRLVCTRVVSRSMYQ